MWKNICRFCRDNNVDECDMEMYFIGDFEILGKYETSELKPGGAEILVTESNKLEYIGCVVNWCLLDSHSYL